MMSREGFIAAEDLPEYLQTADEGLKDSAIAARPEGSVLDEQERLFLVRALEESGWNQSRTARLLSIGRDALRYRLRKHSLAPASERASVVGAS